MVQQIQVFGKCSVRVDSDTLGECRNQADVVQQPFFINVPGDANGGDEGPPIDIQYLGEIVLVRLELTKWDAAIANKVRSRVKGASTGVIPTSGLLMISGGYYVAITLVATTPVLTGSGSTSTLTFPICIVRGAIEFGVGTRFSTFVVEFEAHRDPVSGVLFTGS